MPAVQNSNNTEMCKVKGESPKEAHVSEQPLLTVRFILTSSFIHFLTCKLLVITLYILLCNCTFPI